MYVAFMISWWGAVWVWYQMAAQVGRTSRKEWNGDPLRGSVVILRRRVRSPMTLWTSIDENERTYINVAIRNYSIDTLAIIQIALSINDLSWNICRFFCDLSKNINIHLQLKIVKKLGDIKYIIKMWQKSKISLYLSSTFSTRKHIIDTCKMKN